MYPVLSFIQNDNEIAVGNYLMKNEKISLTSQLTDAFTDLGLKKSDCKIILSGYSNITINLNKLLKRIKQRNIEKIYFFIEDVYRLKIGKEEALFDTHLIEKNPNTIRAGELEIIEYIIKQLDLKEYEIYHCETNGNIVAKNHNLTVGYYDVFVLCAARGMEFRTHVNTPLDNKLEYKLCCFNLRNDWHRYMYAGLISSHPDIFLTLNTYHDSDVVSNYNNLVPLKNFTTDLKEQFIKNNNSILVKHPFVWDGIKTEEHGQYHIDDNNFYIQYNTTEISAKSFLTVVTETRYNSPMQNFSEKVIKPIYAKRPFLLLAPAGTLNLLKELGFKTFNNWWDESYDTITDPVKRLESVYQLSIKILSKDYNQLKKILIQMEDILEHNKQHLDNLGKEMAKLRHTVNI